MCAEPDAALRVGRVARAAARTSPPLRAPALALALSLSACWYPKERGERLEERFDRVASETQGRPSDRETTALQEQARRVEGRLADMQAKIDELRAAARQRPSERAAGQEASPEELARIRASLDGFRATLDGYGRRLDAVEKAGARPNPAEPARAAPAKPERRSSTAKVSRAPERKESVAGRSPAPPGGNEPPSDKARYLALAREQETKGQKAVARELYEEYVKKFPTEPDAAEAHFRLGDLAFGDRRYQDATIEYGKVAKEFPRSERAPEALLRTAESMLKLNLRPEAMSVFADVPKRYPGTPAAHRASQRLTELANVKAGSGSQGK